MKIYDKVVDVGGIDSTVKYFENVRWPYFSHPNPALPNKHAVLQTASLLKDSKRHIPRPLRLSMIASNKVSWGGSTNYTLRRQLMTDSKRMGIHAYGMGWNTSRFSRFRSNFRLFLFFLSQGHFTSPFHVFENLFIKKQPNIEGVTNKFEVLAKSDFHIVIENSSTYVSEKLIDAMVAGCIPLYLGPDLGKYGVPSTCYIVLPNTLEGISATLNDLPINLAQMRKDISEFLNGPLGLVMWQPKVVADEIVKICRST